MASRPRKSRWCAKDKRIAIYIRDQFTCLYCGTDLRDADPKDITLDHLEPRMMDSDNRPRVKTTQDGRPINDVTNLVTACRACNCSRGCRPWREFAPGGAQIRIEIQVARPANYALARALISDQASDLTTDVETR
jgi:hypothetical protein